VPATVPGGACDEARALKAKHATTQMVHRTVRSLRCRPCSGGLPPSGVRHREGACTTVVRSREWRDDYRNYAQRRLREL
jgi:hypothetical protein